MTEETNTHGKIFRAGHKLGKSHLMEGYFQGGFWKQRLYGSLDVRMFIVGDKVVVAKRRIN